MTDWSAMYTTTTVSAENGRTNHRAAVRGHRVALQLISCSFRTEISAFTAEPSLYGIYSCCYTATRVRTVWIWPLTRIGWQCTTYINSLVLDFKPSANSLCFQYQLLTYLLMW